MSFFDTFILAMEIAVLTFTAVVVILAVTVGIVDRRNRRRGAHLDLLTARWRGYLLDGAGAIPELASDTDRFAVLVLFNELCHEVVPPTGGTGDVLDALVANGRRAALDTAGLRLLEGDDVDRIVAFHALGRLGATEAAEAARAYLDDPGTELSRAAARCLLLLDAASLPTVLDHVRDRPDWGPSRVESMLEEIDPRTVEEDLEPAVSIAIAAGNADGAVRLLDHLTCCTGEGARAICRVALHSTTEPEVTAAALRALARVAVADDVLVARHYAGDADPHVRLGALRILRVVGTSEDVTLLREMVADAHFWVRRRAAEALVPLGATRSPEHVALAGGGDPYAHDALIEAAAGVRIVGEHAGADRVSRSTPGERPLVDRP